MIFRLKNVVIIPTKPKLRNIKNSTDNVHSNNKHLKL